MAARGCGIRSSISRISIRKSRTMSSNTPAFSQRCVCWSLWWTHEIGQFFGGF
jgi:hypothetical protein